MNALIELIETKRDELAELCRSYGVERLYLFGSAATDRFVPASSDLDFVVEMANRQPNAAYADRYLGFAEELERLFGRPVDLITEQSIRNPYFRREVEATRQLIYGQPRASSTATTPLTTPPFGASSRAIFPGSSRKWRPCCGKPGKAYETGDRKA